MSVEQAILEAVRSPDKPEEILSHATRLRDEAAPRSVSISAEEIDENGTGGTRSFAADANPAK